MLDKIMKFIDLAKQRSSVRKYTTQKVEKEKLDLMLEATEPGLGSVWICNFKPDVIREEFNLPDNLRPINILAIGYTDSEPADPERHDKMRISLDELLTI